MAVSNRTIMLGQLEELKQREFKLRVQMDGVVKVMLQSFGPLDRNFRYLDDIDPKQLEIYMEDLKRKKLALTGVLAEIADLRRELGEEEE